MKQSPYPLHQAASATARRQLRPASQLLPLEQRFMFDGAVAGAVADAAHAAHAQDSAALPLPPAVTVRAADPSKDGGKKEVALVDTSVANYKSLEAGVRAGVGIVEFDGSRDGLAQIAQWAAGQSGLDAIHILSHGSEAVVNLGSEALTVASLSSATTQVELAQLGHALTADGDLLLYGCDVAAGADGAQLLDGIAKATGADVAASTDATGAARLGGNWTLEAHDGEIGAGALAMADYDRTLSVITLIYGVDGTNNAYITNISKTEATSGKTINFSGAAMLMSQNNLPDDGLYAWNGRSNDNGVSLTIAVQAGYTFDLNSLGMQAEFGSAIFNVTWANGSTSSFTQNGLNRSDVITAVNNFSPPLNDIRSVTITSADYTTFQTFDISDVKLLPPTAVVNTAHLSQDTGNGGAGTASDFITSVAAQTISGTLSASLGSGERVEVSYDGGGTWSNATSYSVGSTAWSTTTTLSGSNTFAARVSNADTSSTAYTHTYGFDRTAPITVFNNLALSADNGPSNTDFKTNTAAQTITATLSVAPDAGDTFSGSLDGGATWVDLTSKISGTSMRWDGATLGAGFGVILLKVTDAAGNDSPLTFEVYTLDTSTPTTHIASVGFSADTGTSHSDFDTKTAAQTISGTLDANLASGEQVYVSLDNGSTWAAATAAAGSSNWSLATTLTTSGTLQVKVGNTYGGDGPVLSQAYTYDTTAPAIAFSGVTLSADTGAAGDFITKTAAQTITATLGAAPAAGDIVYGSLDNGASWADITGKVSGTSLSWNGVTLSAGGTLLLKVTDAAGNDGTAYSHGYTLDTSAPATPGTPVLASASDHGVSNSDGITNINTPALSGSAENGSSVAIYDGATLLGTVTAGAGGWNYTTGVLSEGSHSITVVATDPAGNASAASAALSFSVDRTAPTVASVAAPANATYYGGSALDFTVHFSEAITVDTSGGTPRIAIVLDTGGTVYADYVSGSGGTALVFAYTVGAGVRDLTGVTVGALSANGGTLRDVAGNDASTTLNGLGSTAGVAVDGILPTVTGVDASTADGAYGAGSTITITVTFSGAVTVDTSNGTPTLALDGGGSAIYTGGSGGNTLSFSYVVGAGQNSADLDYSSTSALALNGATIADVNGVHPSALLTLAAPGAAGSLGANRNLDIDTSAPGNSIAGIVFSADSGTLGNDLVTNTAAQTISGTLSANLAAGEQVYLSLDNGATYALATGATGSNVWSLAGRTLTGSGTLKVVVIDAAGNVGATTTRAYVLDTTAPTTSFSNVAFSNDSGASHTDLVTNSAAQTISATLSAAPAGTDIVYGSLDNGATWTDITSKVSGRSLTWNGVTLGASDTLRLRVTDAAGNNGAATGAAYVLDTTAPANDVATAGFSNDSGSNHSDFITNTAAQTVSGTLTNNLAAGDAVYVSLDNGATWTAASASVGSNAWSLSGRTLTASNTLLVKVSDSAGNDGTVLSQAYVYDTAASVPSVDTLATQSLTPVLTGSATLAAGETMTVTVGGATYDVVPVAGAWRLDLSTAVPASGALTLVLNNQYQVAATVTDLAGNIASDHSANELTVGTVAVPTTTAVSGASLSADSGASNSDFITNVAQQTVSGALSAPLQAGESVLVSVDGGLSWKSASAGGSAWSAGVTLAGSGRLEVKVTGGNGDGPVYSRNYVLDTTPPAAPSVDAQTSATTAPTLTGTATLASGETLTVSVGGASYVVAVSGGAWSLDLGRVAPTSGTLALAAGSRYDVTAVATDVAGNTSRDVAAGALLIAGKPSTLVTGVTLSADSGASNGDFITNVAAQTISGTLSAPLTAGQRVEVSLDGGATWRDTGAATGAASWSIAVTLGGGNVFMARVNGDAGAGAVSQHAYTLDATAPVAAPVAATLSSGVLSGGLTAPLGAGESVLVSRDNGASWQTASVSGGAWSSPVGAAGSVLVMVRDTAGNSGAVLTFTPTLTTPPPPDQSVPPVPPIQQVPVVTQAPAPADGGSGGSSPLGVIPTGLVPSIGLSGAPVPNASANPLAPPDIVTLTEPAAMLTTFMPNGLPEPTFAGDALVVNVPIGDVRTGAGQRISVQLAGDAFASTSGGSAFLLAAQSADGTPLPVWLKFDAGSARFDGTPPAGFEGALSVKVTARDTQGRIAAQAFKIIVARDGQAHPLKSTALDRHWTEPAGRSGLSEQLRGASSANAGAGRLALLSRSAAAAKAHP